VAFRDSDDFSLPRAGAQASDGVIEVPGSPSAQPVRRAGDLKMKPAQVGATLTHHIYGDETGDERERFLRNVECSISPEYLDIGPGSPPDWSVFMWRIELTCGSPFGRLLPSCISVLSFYRLYFGGYSIFTIGRSIDLAPLPSDNKSTMGPGFAVAGTPGSPSDVARTKVLLPRL